MSADLPHFDPRRDVDLMALHRGAEYRVVDPELVLPVRHEAIARRVAELVTAELAPGMIPGILAPGVAAPLWEQVADYSGGRLSWYVNPVPVGQATLAPQVIIDARTRSLHWTLGVNGYQLWTGTLREL